MNKYDCTNLLAFKNISLDRRYIKKINEVLNTFDENGILKDVKSLWLFGPSAAPGTIFTMNKLTFLVVGEATDENQIDDLYTRIHGLDMIYDDTRLAVGFEVLSAQEADSKVINGSGLIHSLFLAGNLQLWPLP